MTAGRAGPSGTAEDLAREVAADGVDARRLLQVVSWLATPGRGAAGLRAEVLRSRERAGVQRSLDLGIDTPHDGHGTDGHGTDGLGGDDAFAGVLEVGPAASDAAVPVLERWLRLGVRAATVADGAYPDRLRQGWPDVDAPPLLAWRGQPPFDGPGVAIVGARRATSYGTGVAAWLAEAAATAGARIISGGAVGIDAAAHRAALERPGGTCVVLGCGHAIGYPRAHADDGGLFDQVLDHGGTLLSEHLPDARPHAGNVRARNRIVAALADVVVVVEGGARSGALVTATTAAERGIPVLAVPGDVRAPGSVAPHRLLAEGAGPCTAPADLLDALGADAPAATEDDPARTRPARTGTGTLVTVLPPDVHAELATAWPRSVAVDDLAARTGRPAPVLLGALTRARIAGEVAEDVTGVRLRRAPGSR